MAVVPDDLDEIGATSAENEKVAVVRIALQRFLHLQSAITAVDNVRRIRGDFTVEAARQYLARFRFWGDDPLRS